MELSTDSNVARGKQHFAPRRMGPSIRRQQQREEWRVAVGLPLIWRVAVPHKLGAIRKDFIVDIRVLHLERFVMPCAVDQEKDA